MKIEIRTGTYQFEHGHGPRGSGRWAFGFLIAGAPRNNFVIHYAPGQLLYSAAKKWAWQEADRLGAFYIEVLP